MNGVNPDFSSRGVDAAVGENNAKTSRTGVLGTGFPLDGAGPPSMGQAYLWVGMTFIPVAQQQRGNYSGPASVTIAYYP
jgi:hypothetical protein